MHEAMKTVLHILTINISRETNKYCNMIRMIWRQEWHVIAKHMISKDGSEYFIISLLVYNGPIKYLIHRISMQTTFSYFHRNYFFPGRIGMLRCFDIDSLQFSNILSYARIRLHVDALVSLSRKIRFVF